MADSRNKMGALIALAMVPISVGTLTRDRMKPAFGLSADFWTGTLLGLGIGLLVTAIVIGSRRKRSR